MIDDFELARLGWPIAAAAAIEEAARSCPDGAYVRAQACSPRTRELLTAAMCRRPGVEWVDLGQWEVRVKGRKVEVHVPRPAGGSMGQAVRVEVVFRRGGP